MRTISVEVFSDETNSAVIRIPGRKYPGVLMQGDTLRNIYSLCNEIQNSCSNGDIEEAVALVVELKEQLAGRLVIYESTLHLHRLELPYTDEITSRANNDEG